MNEGKIREKIDRGTKAEVLLRNELLREAFDYLESEFISAWKQSSVQDTQARERLYLLCQNLSALQDYIKNVVEDGKLAKATLQVLKTNKKF